MSGRHAVYKRVVDAGFPSPCNPKWAALREWTETNATLSPLQRSLTESVMDHLEEHPEDFHIPREIVGRVLDADDRACDFTEDLDDQFDEDANY